MEELHQGRQQEVEEEELVGIPARSPTSTSSSSGRLQEPETEEQDAGKRVGTSRRDPWEMVKEENQRADTEVRFSKRHWPLEEPEVTSGIENRFFYIQVEPGQEPKESWQDHQEPTTNKEAMSHKTTRTKRFSRWVENLQAQICLCRPGPGQCR